MRVKVASVASCLMPFLLYHDKLTSSSSLKVLIFANAICVDMAAVSSLHPHLSLSVSSLLSLTCRLSSVIPAPI